MTPSILELYFTGFIALTGLLGNVVLTLRKEGRNRRLKWNYFMFGAAGLLLLSSFLTPPDILSTLLMAGPMTLVYSLFLRTYVFKRLEK